MECDQWQGSQLCGKGIENELPHGFGEALGKTCVEPTTGTAYKPILQRFGVEDEAQRGCERELESYVPKYSGAEYGHKHCCTAKGCQAMTLSAETADLSGQRNMFNGTLGSGTIYTYPAVEGQTYDIEIAMVDNGDEVTFDVWGESGSLLEVKSRKNGEVFHYQHTAESQHVLVVVRPREPWNTDIGVTSLTFQGLGPHPQDRVHVNFIIAGKFTGLGVHNDLVDAADQGAFTDAVMARVNAIWRALPEAS